SDDAWITVDYYSMVGGFIGALCAAVPGLIDLICYKGGAAPAKKIALTHMTSYAIVGLDRNRYASEQGVRRGAYVLADAKDRKPRLILIGERLGGRAARGRRGAPSTRGHRGALRLDA